MAFAFELQVLFHGIHVALPCLWVVVEAAACELPLLWHALRIRLSLVPEEDVRILVDVAQARGAGHSPRHWLICVADIIVLQIVLILLSLSLENRSRFSVFICLILRGDLVHSIVCLGSWLSLNGVLVLDGDLVADVGHRRICRLRCLIVLIKEHLALLF